MWRILTICWFLLSRANAVRESSSSVSCTKDDLYSSLSRDGADFCESVIDSHCESISTPAPYTSYSSDELSSRCECIVTISSSSDTVATSSGGFGLPTETGTYSPPISGTTSTGLATETSTRSESKSPVTSSGSESTSMTGVSSSKSMNSESASGSIFSKPPGSNTTTIVPVTGSVSGDISITRSSSRSTLSTGLSMSMSGSEQTSSSLVTVTIPISSLLTSSFPSNGTRSSVTQTLTHSGTSASSTNATIASSLSISGSSATPEPSSATLDDSKTSSGSSNSSTTRTTMGSWNSTLTEVPAPTGTAGTTGTGQTGSLATAPSNSSQDNSPSTNISISSGSMSTTGPFTTGKPGNFTILPIPATPVSPTSFNSTGSVAITPSGTIGRTTSNVIIIPTGHSSGSWNSSTAVSATLSNGTSGRPPTLTGTAYFSVSGLSKTSSKATAHTTNSWNTTTKISNTGSLQYSSTASTSHPFETGVSSKTTSHWTHLTVPWNSTSTSLPSASGTGVTSTGPSGTEAISQTKSGNGTAASATISTQPTMHNTFTTSIATGSGSIGGSMHPSPTSRGSSSYFPGWNASTLTSASVGITPVPITGSGGGTGSPVASTFANVTKVSSQKTSTIIRPSSGVTNLTGTVSSVPTTSLSSGISTQGSGVLTKPTATGWNSTSIPGTAISTQVSAANGTQSSETATGSVATAANSTTAAMTTLPASITASTGTRGSATYSTANLTIVPTPGVSSSTLGKTSGGDTTPSSSISSMGVISSNPPVPTSGEAITQPANPNATTTATVVMPTPTLITAPGSSSIGSGGASGGSQSSTATLIGSPTSSFSGTNETVPSATPIDAANFTDVFGTSSISGKTCYQLPQDPDGDPARRALLMNNKLRESNVTIPVPYIESISFQSDGLAPLFMTVRDSFEDTFFLDISNRSRLALVDSLGSSMVLDNDGVRFATNSCRYDVNITISDMFAQLADLADVDCAFGNGSVPLSPQNKRADDLQFNQTLYMHDQCGKAITPLIRDYPVLSVGGTNCQDVEIDVGSGRWDFDCTFPGSYSGTLRCQEGVQEDIIDFLLRDPIGGECPGLSTMVATLANTSSDVINEDALRRQLLDSRSGSIDETILNIVVEAYDALWRALQEFFIPIADGENRTTPWEEYISVYNSHRSLEDDICENLHAGEIPLALKLHAGATNNLTITTLNWAPQRSHTYNVTIQDPSEIACCPLGRAANNQGDPSCAYPESAFVGDTNCICGKTAAGLSLAFEATECGNFEGQCKTDSDCGSGGFVCLIGTCCGTGVCVDPYACSQNGTSLVTFDEA